MARWLDFENEKYEKGYTEVEVSAQSFKKLIGKQIVYLRIYDVDSNRGTASPKYDTIHSVRYSQLLINEGDDSIDIRDIIECGVKNDN